MLFTILDDKLLFTFSRSSIFGLVLMIDAWRFVVEAKRHTSRSVFFFLPDISRGLRAKTT